MIAYLLLEFQTPCTMLQLPQTKATQILPPAILFKALTLPPNLSLFIHSLKLFRSVCVGTVYCVLVCLAVGIMFTVVICRMVSYFFTPTQNISPTLLCLVLKAEHTSHIFYYFFLSFIT